MVLVALRVLERFGGIGRILFWKSAKTPKSAKRKKPASFGNQLCTAYCVRYSTAQYSTLHSKTAQ